MLPVYIMYVTRLPLASPLLLYTLDLSFVLPRPFGIVADEGMRVYRIFYNILYTRASSVTTTRISSS